MRSHIIRAIILRSFRGTFMDKGRVAELVIFPFSFLVIWGFFFASDLVPKSIAGQLLVINLIWSVSGTFQSQANLTMMFDIWAREFANILRQGVGIGEMVLSHLIFSTIIGLFNLGIFLIFIVYCFGGTEHETGLLLELFPLYYISAIGLAAMFGGFVIRYGKSYAFIAWTGLQLLIMISSPFAPLDSVPQWLQPIMRLSPYTYIFEYVRFQHISDYWIGLSLSLIYLLLGGISALIFYKKRRAILGLMDV